MQAGEERLSQPLLWAYSLPRAGLAVFSSLFGVYFMKFATDVLLIAPAVVGLIIAGGRIWDAITDPVVGYLSDRTASDHGRRRVWMFASAIPLGFGIVMLWSPPNAVTGIQLIVWVTVALLLYETAITTYYVPHGALGIELTPNYHERTRLFGYAHFISGVGSLAGLSALYWVDVIDDQRSFVSNYSIFAGMVVVVILLLATKALPERVDHQGRGGERLLKSCIDVYRNKHARLLLFVFAIETFGAASVLMLFPYLTEYVWEGMSGKLVWLVITYAVVIFLSAPAWMALSRRFGKKSTWTGAMWLCSVAYLGYFFVVDSGPLVWIVTAFHGCASGCGVVIAQSVQADVVDYDEYVTHQRKEGVYNAVWNLIRKFAGSLTALLTGLILQLSGFEPNVEQSESVTFALRALLALFPSICFAIGASFFMRFRLNESEHAKIRQAIQDRDAA